ncbi:MAG: hypothetical protein C4541_08585 [Candidatus Auribacter fodinae]|jgi:hypothetical protein|uniref:Flagellar assembly protein T N-terminal domain-containing protein n=1 Tax=Candidatus Auribacter fodinae TaxID=2093366 RepID=A0A3A4QWC1_9BACT|nr:MAG: hypothetical protein C4541_08585 [Candidatus Auribacter fodinae]
MSLNKLKLLFACVCLIAIPLCMPNPLLAQDIPAKEIEAEGIAAVVGEGQEALLRARDEATKRALRRAVEQGVGSLVDSESMTQNFQLLNDEVYTQVKGYVTDYSVISDNNGDGQIYRIGVRAAVALAPLEKDLKALNIIKNEKGNPRVIIIFREMVDQTDPVWGGQVQGGVAQSSLEQKLLSKGFPMIDKGQLEMIKQRDAALNYADPDKAAALGRQFGAEVVIIGEASADLVDSAMPYGTPVFYYQAQINARAVNTDTGQVIATANAQSDWRKPGEGQGSGKMEAARQALGAAGVQLAETLVPRILDQWRSDVYNTAPIQLVISNVNGARRRLFKNELKQIRGVASINERSFQDEIMLIDLDVEGSVHKTFDERLEEFTTVGVELTAKTPNRLEIRLFDIE